MSRDLFSNSILTRSYNEFARTLADRSISLVQTPRRRYEGFRMCGIPLEEQVAEKGRLIVPSVRLRLAMLSD